MVSPPKLAWLYLRHTTCINYTMLLILYYSHLIAGNPHPGTDSGWILSSGIHKARSWSCLSEVSDKGMRSYLEQELHPLGNGKLTRKGQNRDQTEWHQWWSSSEVFHCVSFAASCWMKEIKWWQRYYRFQINEMNTHIGILILKYPICCQFIAALLYYGVQCTFIKLK